MARKNGVFDDLVGIATLLPWWLSLIFAAVFYAVMHHFANISVPIITDPKQISQMVTGQVTKTFAIFGQYIVPLAFVL